MKTIGLIMVSLIFTNSLFSQNVDAVFLVDSQAGYSTNTFLHPFINEWDTSDNGAFARVIPSANIYWSRSGLSAEVSGGFMHETIFDDRNSWNGGFGSVQVQYRVTESISAGTVLNGNSMSSGFRKQLVSVVPHLTWTPSIFTKLRARVGSSFRKYNALEQDQEGDYNDRIDLFGVELEHWPTLRWQVRGTAYGLTDENLIENHSFSFSLNRLIRQKSAVTLRFSLNKYTNSFTVNPDGSGTPMGPGAPDTADEMIEQTDQLFRSDISFRYPIAGNLSGSATVAHNTFRTGSGESRSDISASVGFQYFLLGSKLFSRQAGRVEPVWEKRKRDAVVVKVNYSGEGELYLTGDFNDWERPGVALSRQNRKRFAAELKLEPGIYEYKVLQRRNGDEEWVELSDDTMTVSDGFGGTNGLIFIEE